MASLEKQLEYQKVMEVAQTLKNDVSFIREILNEVKQTRPQVESNWQGKSQSAYLTNFFATAAKFEPFCNYVDSYANDLVGVANAFKTEDEKLARIQGN